MASITREPNGHRTVQLVCVDGKRRSVRLGKASQRSAETAKRHIEALHAAKITGSAVDPDTAHWVASRPLSLRKRLARVGLIDPPAHEAKDNTLSLGRMLEQYLAKRTDAKQSSKTVWGHTKRNLEEFFGKSRPIARITPGEARDFERYLRTTARKNRYAGKSKKDALSPDTIRKRIGIAKQFFADAIDRKLIETNPFAKLKSTVIGNRERDFFITREMTAHLIDAAPDTQWRLIIALSRYGGLRCPSEHLALRLDDADWKRDRLRIRSPKTEHHDGKAYRFIPIFPELRPYLLEVSEHAPPGTEYFITRYRSTDQNLRTTFLKIIRRAKLQPWPKLFHNMRASRQTELEELFPSHVVCSWIGNSPQVAKRHYLQVTEEHFSRAIQSAIETGSDASGKAVQNPVQHVHAGSRGESPRVRKTLESAEKCVILAKTRTPPMDDEGLEPPTPSV